MSASLALVVAVTTGGGDPVNTATLRAAEQALGAAATVEVVEVSGGDDPELTHIADEKHAAIALVRWQNPSSAVVHFRGRESTRWIDRTVVFESDDAPEERGRALGFTLASMMPQELIAPRSAESVAVAQPAPRRWLGAVDVTASGAFAPEEFGTGLGAQLGFSLFWRRLGVRLGWSIRAGDIPPAQATALYVSGSLGLGFRFIDPHPHQRFGFGGRVDALLLYQSVTHLSPDDPAPAHQDRWLPGADAVLLGTFDLTSAAAIVVTAGVETAFGVTRIFIGQAEVAQVFPVRIVADIGVLGRF